MSASEPSPPRAVDQFLDSEPSLPARVGHRYQVVERLGRGGSAVVYRVRDASRGQELALKQLLQPGSMHDRALRSLFEREFHVLAQLSHPSVIEVRDFGIDVAGPYYTMELLDQGDLTTHAPWPYVHACQLMMQICSALSLLHSRRLVHRDVSPRNVRCTEQGTAKLIDFGAMTPMGPCLQVVGTPGFIAPEVVHRMPLDARTDLFSLGATLYYAITGCRPFAARTIAELTDAWHHEPTPPSAVVAGIPMALDALILSLLRMDPASRPSSAFEVMQRLAAIAGQPLTESGEISHAYLSTPSLVGRDAQQRRFAQCLSRAMHAQGGGVLLSGAPGLGRSRLLDACVLEAKTSGATVLRFAGRAARADAAFACVHQLAEQLLEALPEGAQAYAADAHADATLFVTADEQPDAALHVGTMLRSIEELGTDPYAAQAALLRWLGRVAESQSLVIAVDDVERIDDASLAVLVALVHGAHAARLLVVSTAPNPIDSETQPALSVLKARCTTLVLEPLTDREMGALIGSVFADAPNATLVSDRIHKLAAGSPREALALVQHMLDRALIRFADGNWILPTELAVSDLPASVEEARRSQLGSLHALPRRFAELQALAMEGPWTRADYALLAADSSEAQVDEALAALRRQNVIVDKAGAFTLSGLGLRGSIVSQLTAADRLAHERALAELCARTERPILVEVYHLFHADCPERGLDRLNPLLDGRGTAQSLRQQCGLHDKLIAQIIERAHELSIALARNARETHALAQLLLSLSLGTESGLYYRHAPAWLAQLERDSGLSDYRATNANASDRLEQALRLTESRYANTTEMERVYRADEAIKYLAHYVSMSSVIGVRTRDTRLLCSLPELLQPFSVLSPIMYALWQNALGAVEQYCWGRIEHARALWLDAYERLRHVSSQEVPYVDAVRGAVAHAIASAEVTLDHSSAEQWIAKMERDPVQRVAAQHLRRGMCLFDGDSEGARRHRQQAELLAVQLNTRQMFNPPMLLELSVQEHVGDLTGVKQTANRIAQLAADWPGWRAYHELAQGTFHRMRGALAAAKDAFERGLALSDPDQTDQPPMLPAWVATAAGYIMVLRDLGLLERARDFGLRVCERCDALGISAGGSAHTRALALVEAQLGEHVSAAARLDRAIATRAQLRASAVAVDLEARACVALMAKDATAAMHFTENAIRAAAAVSGTVAIATRRRLLDEAKRAGVEMDMPRSDFEAKVLGPASIPAVVPNHVLTNLTQLSDPRARAARVLELLAEAAGASAGQLYYGAHPNLVHVATRAAPLDPALDRFASGFVRRRVEQAAMTTVFTVADEVSQAGFATWADLRGNVYRVACLNGQAEGSCAGVIALCDAPGLAPNPEYRALSIALSDRLLELGDARRIVAR
jgi:hypothetical protein